MIAMIESKSIVRCFPTYFEKIMVSSDDAVSAINELKMIA